MTMKEDEAVSAVIINLDDDELLKIWRSLELEWMAGIPRTLHAATLHS